MNEQRYSDIRREMLETIRQQLAISARYDAVRDEHAAAHKIRGTVETVVEDGAKSGLISAFSKALEAVAGKCITVKEDGVAAVVRQIIEETSSQRVAISDSSLVKRVMHRVNADVEVLTSPSPVELFDCNLGITSAQWAVAETGTLVLESEKERHRLISLVPSVHVAIIESKNICQRLEEVLTTLNERGKENLSRTVTFITGPSRTSDIELTLAIGVHGPAQLYAIIIEGNDND